jgi:two-component system response regulator MprA
VFACGGGMMKNRILLVEDDDGVLGKLHQILADEGFQVDKVRDEQNALIFLQLNRPSIIIINLIRSETSEADCCKRIRELHSIPILLLSFKNRTEDRVKGLDAGADDYMVKPFDNQELQARIRALLRRSQIEQSPVFSFEDLVLDTSSRRATRKNRIIGLTAKEFDLLEMFMRHPRQVLSREVIFDRVWGYDFGGESNVLDVYIRYLRQKLELNGEPRLLFTIRGVGYVLREG